MGQFITSLNLRNCLIRGKIPALPKFTESMGRSNEMMHMKVLCKIFKSCDTRVKWYYEVNLIYLHFHFKWLTYNLFPGKFFHNNVIMETFQMVLAYYIKLETSVFAKSYLTALVLYREPEKTERWKI